MADFCRQCSAEMFGADSKGDMEGLITEEKCREGMVARGLCEGCVGGEFDHEGNCLGGCQNPEHDVQGIEYERRLNRGVPGSSK